MNRKWIGVSIVSAIGLICLIVASSLVFSLISASKESMRSGVPMGASITTWITLITSVLGVPTSGILALILAFLKSASPVIDNVITNRDQTARNSEKEAESSDNEGLIRESVDVGEIGVYRYLLKHTKNPDEKRALVLAARALCDTLRDGWFPNEGDTIDVKGQCEVKMKREV